MNVRYASLRLSSVLACLCLGVLLSIQSVAAQTAPTVKIVSIADGATVDGPVLLRIEHQGMVFSTKNYGKDPEPGVGHWHIKIDDKHAGLSVTDIIEIPNDAYPTIPAGQHKITASLQQNNHTNFEPPIEHTITVNFAKEVSLVTPADGPPSIKLVDPGKTLDGTNTILVRIEHSGFRFNGVRIGTEPEPASGHWHVNVDGKYAGLAVSNVIEIPNPTMPMIPAGQHTITVDFHHHNHADLDPPVAESFSLDLSADLAIDQAAVPAQQEQAVHTPAQPEQAMGALPNTAAVGTNWVLAVVLGFGCLIAGAWLVRRDRRLRTRA
jgi:hypothetical protein